MNNGILAQPSVPIPVPYGLLGGPYSVPTPRHSSPFRGGNLVAGSLFEAALAMATAPPGSPEVGGSLSINGESLGSYEYAARPSQSISVFNSSEWFTNTADTRSAWCIVSGDLTIQPGVTFIPPVRKLFTVLVVTGNLTVRGTISMTARGANHSGSGNSGGATTASNIRIINGTYSGIADPQVPAAGGSGGANTTTNTGGNAGSAGTGGGTGGGASGSHSSGAPRGTNGGAAGTSFSGGSGGGSKSGLNTATPGQPNGGAGGSSTGAQTGSGGGAGNPGGLATGGGAVSGPDGTGGVLIVIVLGTLAGTGSVQANGTSGGASSNPGGGSGGGSVTILSRLDFSSITPAANGGALGGGGGAGTARKLSL